jgi:hypothetical protein
VQREVPRSDIFVHPGNYVGKPVNVCGYILDGSNIIEGKSYSHPRLTGGLSILEMGDVGFRYKGHICVEGVIEYAGCETGDVVCTDAAFDYGIKVRKVFH